jgi:2-polyprenyl-3-methyl-5-hydroxy-6-metoxy-1,4-benzoquinol methylase
MAGQKIPMASKVRSAASIYRAHRDRVFGNATSTLEYHDELRAYFDRFVGKPIAGARILDLGCGQTATQTALFHADGARVTGIDIEVPTYRMSR